MLLTRPKYYLQAENDRNVHHGDLFIELVKRAFGADEVVRVGHHFVFEPAEAMKNLDLTKLNEIPSADTMLFDHDIMHAVFGDQAVNYMQRLASVPVEARDVVLRELLAQTPA